MRASIRQGEQIESTDRSCRGRARSVRLRASSGRPQPPTVPSRPIPPRHGRPRLVSPSDLSLDLDQILTRSMMLSPGSLLPTPRYSAPRVQSDDEDDTVAPTSGPSAPSTALTSRIPPYGGRKGWRPTKQEDFGDGGAYPECSLAQYPLDLGRKKVSQLPSRPHSRTQPLLTY